MNKWYKLISQIIKEGIRQVSLVPSILRNSNNDNEKGKKRKREERGAKPSAKKV